MTYKTIELIDIDYITQEKIISIAICKIEPNKNEIWIPQDEANADYQQYLIDTDGGLLIPAVADAPADSTTTK